MQYEYLARVGARNVSGVVSAASRKQAQRLIREAWPGAHIVTISRGKRSLTPAAWDGLGEDSGEDEEEWP